MDKVTSNPTRKLNDIYDEKLQGSSLEFIPICGQVRATMSKLRSKILIPIPSTIEELKIEGEWGKTFRGEPFLLYLDGQSEVVIFAPIIPYQP